MSNFEFFGDFETERLMIELSDKKNVVNTWKPNGRCKTDVKW